MKTIDEIYSTGKRKLEEKGLLQWCEGGAGSLQTLKENRQALSELYIAFRTFHERYQPDLRTTFFGAESRAPLAPASVAGLSRVDPDGEVFLVEACSTVGLPVFLSDSIRNDIAELVERATVPVFWVLKPLSDLDEMAKTLEKAEKSGVTGVGINVDVAYGLQSGNKIVELNGVGPTDKSYYEKVLKMTGLPTFIKGILHASDAKRVMEMGYDGIVLSNHGGRVLDFASSPIRTLPAIKKEATSEILVDGGFRYAVDIYKALALGARGVLLGRPILYALAAGGRDALVSLLNTLIDDLERIFGLAGSRDVSSIDSSTLMNIGRGNGLRA